MKTAQQRIAHYEARMSSTLLDPTLSAVSAKAAANFTSYAVEFVPMQQAVAAILDAEDVPVIQRAAYQAYNGEMYHASKTSAGPALATLTDVLVTKWSDTAHLGTGAATTLRRIAVDVYHVDVAAISP